jgi:hypothetical protein
MAARRFCEPEYRPATQPSIHRPDFTVENDFDFTSPYPCGVCKQEFNSRSLLATHAHPKRSA